MHVRSIALAVVLVGISALALTPPLHAQETPDELRALAEQGDARAQVALGFRYALGVGVPQDYVEAHMWFNLAAAQSSAEDRDRRVKARNDVAKRMTAEQIAEAQRRAREWQPTPEPRSHEDGDSF